MQILQWLSKVSQEPPKEPVLNHTSLTKRDKKATKNTTEILVFVESGRVKRKNNKTVEQTKVNCENLNLFSFLQRKDVSKAYFYHTLNLTKLRSFRKSGHSLDSTKFTKREDSASSAHGGSKVLPITDSSSHSPSSSRRSSVDQRLVKDYEKEKPKTKNVSKMKELVRWASGLKPEKRGKFGKNELHIKNKPASMNVPNDDEDDRLRISESPKISFTWELSETNNSSSYCVIPDISTSTAILSSKKEELINLASVKSAHFHVSDGAQCGAKLGNWITTDSEFVVLEL